MARRRIVSSAAAADRYSRPTASISRAPSGAHPARARATMNTARFILYLGLLAQQSRRFPVSGGPGRQSLERRPRWRRDRRVAERAARAPFSRRVEVCLKCAIRADQHIDDRWIGGRRACLDEQRGVINFVEHGKLSDTELPRGGVLVVRSATV